MQLSGKLVGGREYAAAEVQVAANSIKPSFFSKVKFRKVIGESLLPTLQMRPHQNEEDFWRICQFLRQVFLLNQRRELSWHVARFDYFRC
jgi:hypothetical protein